VVINRVVQCFIFLVLSVFVVTQVNAQDGDVRGILGFGADFGGENVVTFYKTDGGTDTIDANDGFLIYGGAEMPLEEFSVRGILGYKHASVKASNGDATMTRMLAELLAVKPVDNHRFVAGLQYQNSPEFECSVPGICVGNIQFESSIGFVLEYNYELPLPNDPSSSYLFGGRYTNSKLTVSGTSESLDASGFGLFMSFLF